MSDPGAEALPASLLLVGAGRMGGALLKGWLDLGLAPERLFLLEPQPSPEIAALADARRIAFAVPAQAPDVVVLAVKPQIFEDAAILLRAAVSPQTLILSIMAGKTIANIAARLPQARSLIRAMPNLPASIGCGISGAFANSAVSETQRCVADRLLSGVGKVEWLDDEGLIDAVTAVSGSGPAYVFLLAECLAEAGVAAGLPAATAARLARATVEGAGALLAQSAALSAAALREAVTSPGGTTAAALAVLMGPQGLGPLLETAVEAAKRRAGELSG